MLEALSGLLGLVRELLPFLRQEAPAVIECDANLRDDGLVHLRVGVRALPNRPRVRFVAVELRRPAVAMTRVDPTRPSQTGRRIVVDRLVEHEVECLATFAPPRRWWWRRIKLVVELRDQGRTKRLPYYPEPVGT